MFKKEPISLKIKSIHNRTSDDNDENCNPNSPDRFDLAVSTPPSQYGLDLAAFSKDRMMPFGTSIVVKLSTSPTEEHIRTLLRNLRSSDSVDQAVESMRALRKPLASDVDHEIKNATAIIVSELNGPAVILMALKEWYSQSQDFSNLAIRTLIQITCFVSKTRRFIAESGGIRTLVVTAKAFPGDYRINASAVGLFTNLSMSESSRFDLAIEDCIDMVTDAMKKWPDDVYLQRCGCIYFSNICTIEQVQDRLHRKKVGILLSNLLENFYFKEGSDDIYEIARDALNTYMKR
jgi:hypothetical protein